MANKTIQMSIVSHLRPCAGNPDLFFDLPQVSFMFQKTTFVGYVYLK